MLGRVFATQSSVSAKELRCVLLLGNTSTDTLLLRTLMCYSNRGDADNGYNDSHHVGLVLLMDEREKTCLEYAVWHTKVWSFRHKISTKANYLEYLLSRRYN